MAGTLQQLINNFQQFFNIYLKTHAEESWPHYHIATKTLMYELNQLLVRKHTDADIKKIVTAAIREAEEDKSFWRRALMAVDIDNIYQEWLLKTPEEKLEVPALLETISKQDKDIAEFKTQIAALKAAKEALAESVKSTSGAASDAGKEVTKLVEKYEGTIKELTDKNSKLQEMNQKLELQLQETRHKLSISSLIAQSQTQSKQQNVMGSETGSLSSVTSVKDTKLYKDIGKMILGEVRFKIVDDLVNATGPASLSLGTSKDEEKSIKPTLVRLINALCADAIEPKPTPTLQFVREWITANAEGNESLLPFTLEDEALTKGKDNPNPKYSNGGNSAKVILSRAFEKGYWLPQNYDIALSLNPNMRSRARSDGGISTSGRSVLRMMAQ